MLSTVPTAAFWPGWVWSKWLYKLCRQSKQLEVQHLHAASSGTSVPYLLHGVKFAGRDSCIRDCTDSTFHFHAVFPAQQQEGASPRSPMSSLPAGPGPTRGYQGYQGEERGCWASPIWLQGAHWQFRYHRKRSSNFCTAFTRVEARIMSFQLVLKLMEFSYFWDTWTFVLSLLQREQSMGVPRSDALRTCQMHEGMAWKSGQVNVGPGSGQGSLWTFFPQVSIWL